MTRLSLLSSVLAAPFAVLAAPSAVPKTKPEEHTILFGPGTIAIAAGGGIRISGVQQCRIENCTFTGPSEATGASEAIRVD
jgi:hypothetical protein